MKLITICFVENDDIKETSRNTKIGKLTADDLISPIPAEAEFVYGISNDEDSREIMNKLNSDLNKYGYFCELPLLKK